MSLLCLLDYYLLVSGVIAILHVIAIASLLDRKLCSGLWFLFIGCFAIVITVLISKYYKLNYHSHLENVVFLQAIFINLVNIPRFSFTKLP